jgi:PAS domain S-box-containing protein
MAQYDELLSLFINAVEDHAIFLLDPAGQVLTWNPAAQRITGYCEREIVGQPLCVLYPPDDQSLATERIHRVAAEGHCQAAGWMTRRDGRLFWGDVSLTALRDDQGQRCGIAVIVRDLTERHQAEGDLLQTKLKYDLLMAGVQEYAIFLMDPEGRVTDWNAAAERLLGYSQEEIIGQHFAIFWTAEEGEPGGIAEQELKQAVASGSASDDRWHVRKNGTHFWANGITSALRDDQGSLRGFAKVLRDKTDSKRFEEELRAKADALQEADRHKNEFLAMLAHELRNPLAPIATAVTLLKVTEQCETGRQAVEVIDRQVRKFTRLINDLMDVSRITRGKIQLHLKRVDLRSCIGNAVSTSDAMISERHHSLSVSLPEEPIWVLADATRLEQIFENLLNNAAKYTETGGTISLRAQICDAQAIVEVQDTGVGIAPELMPHIFDLFTQADCTLDRAEGGLGIGLTIVKSIVEMHDGKVAAATEGPGKGSVFSVRLPLMLNAQLARITTTTEPAPQAEKVKVLVVDDNVDAANMLAMLLKTKGHQVLSESCGLTALEVSVQYQPHMILLDIGLPGMDGYKVAQRLREQHATKNILLVALTGYGQPEDRQRSKDAGFDYHLVKPVDIDDIQAIIGSIKPPTAAC